MNVLLASALFSLLRPVYAPVTVNVNAQNGDTIMGERTFRVTVQTNNTVTGVEFYVGGDLRDKATATPYTFTLDTLAETEGDLALKFKAYTSEGETGEKVINVHVDNQLGKGVDFHIQAGTSALQDGNFDSAVTEGRIALKIDPKSNAARVLVARAYVREDKYDRAQKFAEDAVADDPNNAGATDLLSVILLREAFTTFNRDSDRKETLAAIRDNMVKAVETRRKWVEAAFDKMGEPTDTTALTYADAALATGQYSTAVGVLQSIFRKDQRKTEIANRLIYAQLKIGRFRDALTTLNELKQFGQPDSYTDAEAAILYAELGDAVSSDAALKDALVANPDDPAVLCAQAYIALKYFRTQLLDKVTFEINFDTMTTKSQAARAESRKLMRAALDQLEKNSTGRSEVEAYAAALNNYMQEYGPGQHDFELAVLADPLNVDAWVEQGNRSIGDTMHGTSSADQTDQALGTARAYYEAALAARPNSPRALAGLSLVSTIERKYVEATKWGEATTKAAPTYASGYIILATAYTLQSQAQGQAAEAVRKQNTSAGTTNEERQANELKTRELESQAQDSSRKGRDALATAERLDPHLAGIIVTKPAIAWRYFYAGGRMPMLPLPH